MNKYLQFDVNIKTVYCGYLLLFCFIIQNVDMMNYFCLKKIKNKQYDTKKNKYLHD